MRASGVKRIVLHGRTLKFLRIDSHEFCHNLSTILFAFATFSNSDAIEFMESNITTWSDKTLIYLDPPYFKKGRDLYYDFYSSSDHADVAAFVKERLRIPKRVVSYDSVAEIRALYDGWKYGTYTIGYIARSANEGSEVMFF